MATTFGLDTVTWKVAEPDCARLSVTVTVTVKFPSSPYVCDAVPSEPRLLGVNVVCAVPSPQLTSAIHELASFASLNDPRAKEAEVPSVAGWLPGDETTKV